MRRFLAVLFATLTPALAAQPIVSSQETVHGLESHPSVVSYPNAETPTQAEPRNTVLVEGGGLSVAGSIRYERRVLGPLVGTVGYAQARLDGVTYRILPVGAMVVQPLGGRWRADVGASVVLSYNRDPGDADIETQSWTRAIPTVSTGVRYERERLHLRLGAGLVFGHRRVSREDSGWFAFPWPAASAGVRF